MEFCTDYNFLSGVLIVKYFYNVILIVLPIIMIIVGTLDGFKAVTAGNADEVKNIIFNTGFRAASFLIILLLPNIIHIVFSGVDGYDGVYNDLTICMNNANSEVIAGLKRARELELRDQETTTQSYLVKYNNAKHISLSSKSGASQVSGKGEFVKYDLSDSQLNNLASICFREQGSAEGAAAEASLMANLYELKGGGYGEGADGLYNYVHNGGWFNGKNMNGTTTDQEVINAVKSVLVDGKRTLPGYVDEHDCIDCGAYGHDVTSTTNNGQSFPPSDKSQYKQHTTVIKNKYGSTYTFYSFPTDTSDPFGYTSQENRERIGDDCYSYS